MNYLFSFVSKLALPFDSGRSGPFSPNFLVGFRGFDSFQFRHLVVAGQKWTHTLFSLFRERREIQSVGFIQENLLSDGRLSGNKGRKSRPKLLSQKWNLLLTFPATIFRTRLVDWLTVWNLLPVCALCRVSTPSRRRLVHFVANYHKTREKMVSRVCIKREIAL